MARPTLSIVIITRDTKELVRNLLTSIENDTSLQPGLCEVILVDNASLDGTSEMAQTLFPRVRYIRNSSNIGFAASANKGYLASKGDYILFLNSDTVLIPGEIPKMLGFMESDARAGIAGPQLVYPDMKRQRSFAFLPCLLFEIVPQSLLERIMPGKYPGKKRAYHAPFRVPSVIGAALMARRETLGALSGFDEDFFFFLEETDLCVRSEHHGYGVVFCPQASVVHLQGKTVRQNWIRGRMEYNISLYKFIRKHHSGGYFRAFQTLRLLKCVVYLFLCSLLPVLLLRQRIRRTYQYYVRLFRWHLGGCRDDAGIRPSSPERRLPQA
jgi:N-acetylglucosaminyl-diphospho-decaprenol L-rhamnosyltransferase